MAAVTPSDEIEFIENGTHAGHAGVSLLGETGETGVTGETAETPRSLLRLVGVVLVAVSCVWLVLADRETSQPEESDAAQPQSQEPTGSREVSGWPSPPVARDPAVTHTQGPAEVPAGFGSARLEDTTIVYVNAAGVPTVVSFDSGDVFEVEVAAIRVHETFAVESGRVVSLEGSNPALDDASNGAIVFHTYRDVDAPGVGTMSDLRGVGRGPELCLSARSCARTGWGVDRMVASGFVAERFDPAAHWAVDDILTTWTAQDGWLRSADGFGIPAPVGVVWVLRPPSGGAASSSGLL